MKNSVSLKLVHVAVPTDGGVARYIRQVLPLLSANGMDVHFVHPTARSSGFQDTLRELTEAGVKLCEVDMTNSIAPAQDFASMVRLRNVFKATKPDVVHLHSSKAGAIGRIAALLLPIRAVVYTPHAFSFLNRSSRFNSTIYYLVERVLSSLVDHVIAVSDSEKMIAKTHLYIPDNNITVIPNGVRLSSLSCEPSSNWLSTNNHKVRIGFIGRLVSQKGPLVLIQLAKELRRLKLVFQIDIVGVGPLLQTCYEKCASEKLDNVFHFSGDVQDISTFLNSIDILVTTSSYEGLPYTVLDAMTYGVPVVGFDVVGVRDAISSSSYGVLVPPGDVQEMAKQVFKLANHPLYRKLLADMARERVRTYFDLDQQIRTLISIYQKLVQVDQPRLT